MMKNLSKSKVYECLIKIGFKITTQSSHNKLAKNFLKPP